jgi:outer membrane immunogenic protein
MKKFVLISAAILALGATAPARAADLPVMPVKAPPLVVYSWTGWYIGLNAGYSWGRSNTTLDLLNGATGAVLATTNGKLNLNGWLVGGQLGYNWQSGSWVLGVEGDIQWANEKGSTGVSCNTIFCLPTAIVAGGVLASTVTLNQKIDWFGTLRGRLGTTVISPTVLLYVTGGLAFGHVKSDLTVSGFNANGAPIGLASSTSDTNLGWVAGAGLEGVISGRWTGKVEYLYMDLGTFSGTSAVLAAGPPTLQARFSSKVTDHILRAGLNYRFSP